MYSKDYRVKLSVEKFGVSFWFVFFRVAKDKVIMTRQLLSYPSENDE